MPLDPVLRTLLTAHGPTGYERAPAAAWLDAARAVATDVRADALGSGVARVAGTREGPTVAVMGHIDEIGLLLTHIDDDGFVSFRRIGSWDPEVLVSQRVSIATRNGAVPGVVGKKPIHLTREEPPRAHPLALHELHIDLGASSRAEAEALVEVGDVAVIAGEPLELAGERVAARSLDNRLGCWVALEVLRLVAEAGGAAGDVIGVAAVQEENGLSTGAQVVAHELRPDVAIVVDVSFETTPPGHDPRQLGVHPFGSGPMIARGSILHPHVVERLRATAREQGIPHTVMASGIPTMSDADTVHCVRAGIPTAVVFLPLRYMHSSVETCDLGDVANAAKLIAAFCLGLEPGLQLSR